MRGRGRPSEGLSEALQARTTPDEAQMARDTAAQLGLSQNKALRWAIRYAWQHATSTTDHSTCPPNSPCAGATRGLTPGRQHAAAARNTDQMTITHSATVEEHP
jgi:hypothetical protein